MNESKFAPNNMYEQPSRPNNQLDLALFIEFNPWMQKIGGYLFFFGVGSMILTLINVEFVILMWIDLWGPTVGWAIRIAMAVIGGGLWLTGRARGGQAGD
jgi:hypothetical protein